MKIIFDQLAVHTFVIDRIVLLCCQDECSFVSLRDVDRTLQVMLWFYNHHELFEMMDDKAAAEADSETDEELEALQVVFIPSFHVTLFTVPFLIVMELILLLEICYIWELVSMTFIDSSARY